MSAKRYFFLGLALSVFIAACNNNTDCDTGITCDTQYPVSGLLSIRVTLNAENTRVPVAVYKGQVEDSVLYFVDTLYSEKISYNVDVEQRYSAVARYNAGDKTILAIDGDKVKVSSEENCGYDCYTVKDAALRLDLR